MLGTFVFRVDEHLIGRSLFNDNAAVHKDNVVGNFPRESHFVRNDDHCHFVFRKLFYYFENLTRKLRVERRSRLIEEQHLGVESERSCNGNTLLLTARKLAGISFCLVFKSHFFEKLHSLFLSFVLGHFEDAYGRFGDVAEHVHVRKKVKILKNKSYFQANFAEFSI